VQEASTPFFAESASGKNRPGVLTNWLCPGVDNLSLSLRGRVKPGPGLKMWGRNIPSFQQLPRIIVRAVDIIVIHRRKRAAKTHT
jgi:hypothetical protein